VVVLNEVVKEVEVDRGLVVVVIDVFAVTVAVELTDAVMWTLAVTTAWLVEVDLMVEVICLVLVLVTVLVTVDMPFALASRLSWPWSYEV
jgi:hypothetical protein